MSSNHWWVEANELDESITEISGEGYDGAGASFVTLQFTPEELSQLIEELLDVKKVVEGSSDE